MRIFRDAGLPAAIGVGTGILCAVYGYGVVETIAFVTVFYLLWRIVLWRVQ